MDEKALTAPVEPPLLTPVHVETHSLDDLRRLSRWQTRVATGNTEMLNPALLLAGPIPVAA